MKRILITLLFSTYIFLADAGVNYRTGNFYMSYDDVDFPGSTTAITRTYNSTNTNIGLFGYGWGTLMETKLYALPEGTLYIKWWGVGGGTIFESPVTDRKGLYFMINEIIKYEIKMDKLENSPVAIQQRKAELVGDAGKRNTKYIELVEKKIVPPYTQSNATKKIWKPDINQVIVWDGRQYSLQSWDYQYVFNPIGLMTEVIQPNTRMKLFYTKNQLSGILVDDKYHCNISTDSTGKITRLLYTDSSGQKEATFTYDQNNDLLYSKDAGNNEYRYRYDKAHNLVRISYTDTTFMEINYDPVTYRAIRVKEKNGSANAYQYPYFYTEDGKVNLLHYATKIMTYDSTGKLIFTKYYEFESKTKSDGEDYLYRRLAQTDTSYDEALYVADAGNAYYRRKNEKEAWAGYDKKNRCTYLHINDTVYRNSYNWMDKAEKFWQIDSLRNDTTLFQYAYDQAGNLKETRKKDKLYFIKGSKGQGQVEVRQNNQRLLIKFKNGNPCSIENKEWGSLVLDENMGTKVEIHETAKDVTPGSNSRTNINKMEEAKARAIASRDKARSQKSENENHRRLRILYEEFKDIFEAKVIAHEWIWERL